MSCPACLQHDECDIELKLVIIAKASFFTFNLISNHPEKTCFLQQIIDVENGTIQKQVSDEMFKCNI